MSLFVDGQPNRLEHLTEADGGVAMVAASEQIDLGAKMAQARKEIGQELAKFFAVYQADSGYGIENVVVTEGLALWHTMHSLTLAYRDAYYSQLNDRYKGRLKEFESQARQAREDYFAAGVGVTATPVHAGGKPLTALSSEGSAPGIWRMAISWVTNEGMEGDCGETVDAQAPEGSTIQVSAPEAPDGAARWNIYAGLLEGRLSKQNAEPLEPGQSWLIQAGIDGPAPSGGQKPDEYLKRVRLLWRG
jgi:hypothetical protein